MRPPAVDINDKTGAPRALSGWEIPPLTASPAADEVIEMTQGPLFLPILQPTEGREWVNNRHSPVGEVEPHDGCTLN